MNKIIKKLPVIAFFLFSFLLIARNAMAASSLEVDFNRSPLFSAEKIEPGSIFASSFKVKNIDSKKAIIEAKVNGDLTIHGLPEVLEVKIARESTIIYNDSLQALMQAEKIHLDNLNSGEQAVYKIEIGMDKNAGNSFQSQKTSFDLLIGTQENNGGGGGGGGGGGNGNGPVIIPLLKNSQDSKDAPLNLELPEIKKDNNIDQKNVAKPLLRLKDKQGPKKANPGEEKVPMKATLVNDGDLTSVNSYVIIRLPKDLIFSDEPDKKQKTLQLGDLAPKKGKDFNFTINVSEKATEADYIISLTAGSQNHPELSEEIKLKITPVLVQGVEMSLPETGWSKNEFIFLLSLLTLSLLMSASFRKLKTKL